MVDWLIYLSIYLMTWYMCFWSLKVIWQNTVNFSGICPALLYLIWIWSSLKKKLTHFPWKENLESIRNFFFPSLNFFVGGERWGIIVEIYYVTYFSLQILLKDISFKSRKNTKKQQHANFIELVMVIIKMKIQKYLYK